MIQAPHGFADQAKVYLAGLAIFWNAKRRIRENPAIPRRLLAFDKYHMPVLCPWEIPQAADVSSAPHSPHFLRNLLRCA
jgi:hypothetical protein